ncbi:DUF4349 domain-containing protein [Streptomyces sp. JNUCC 64]
MSVPRGPEPAKDREDRTTRPVRAARHRARPVAGVLLAASLALAGCGGSGGDAGETKSDLSNAKAYSPEDGGGARADGPRSGSEAAEEDGKAAKLRSDQLAERKIVRTAQLTIRVEDVSRALVRARAAAESVGGLVGEESTDRDDEGREHSELTLRVPQEKYDDVLERLGDTGTVVSRNTSAEDVTEQVVDVETRLKNQRASVNRLRALMDEATKISDVVALEGELSSRQAELESLLARRESLGDRVALATITLSLTERSDAGDDDGESGFLSAVGDGWDAFTAMLRWLTVALGAALPFLALTAALVALWRWLLRPRTARRRTTATPPPAPVAPAPATVTDSPATAPAPAPPAGTPDTD